VQFHSDVKIGDLGVPCVDCLVIDGSRVVSRLSDVPVEVCCKFGTRNEYIPLCSIGRHVGNPLLQFF